MVPKTHTGGTAQTQDGRLQAVNKKGEQIFNVSRGARTHLSHGEIKGTLVLFRVSQARVNPVSTLENDFGIALLIV